MAQSDNRPVAPERPHKLLQPKTKTAELMGRIPAKIIDKIRNNTKLRDCCRDVEPSEVELFDTDGNGLPDLLVMTCNECGRKQRFLAGGGDKPVPVIK
jgi:hypothetical protein